MSKRKTSNEGLVFVVSSPSGAGKTTLVRELLKKDRRLRKTISHTTREPRPGERNGKDYAFVTERRFGTMVRRKEFLEWAKVYGQRYGTSIRTIEGILRAGKDAVLVIESKGAREVRRLFPEQAVFIRVLPPSLPELRRRIYGRPGTTPLVANRRLTQAKEEIRAMRWYPYTVVNDRFGAALNELRAIVRKERLLRSKTQKPA